MSKFVLVVDDDESIRDSLCELLEDEGHRAVGAANGQEALDILRRDGRPCIILLDMMMPVMDGASFRAEQVKDPALSAIPVAVITAAGKNAADGLNVDVVLPKPLMIDDVLAVVDRYCPGQVDA
jgi:CheY-like chemotaxis protein